MHLDRVKAPHAVQCMSAVADLQSCNAQVAGLCQRYGGRQRFVIVNFAYKNHVWCKARGIFKGYLCRRGVATYFALINN